MICIYHGIDLDGWCSAAIVKLKYPDCVLLPFNYGQSIPTFTNKKEPLILVDVSFPIDVFMKLWADGHDITWIDHHASTIRYYDSSSLKDFVNGTQGFHAILDTKKAACELTWETMYPNEIMPIAVSLLGRYDCFGHIGTLDEYKTLIFQYAARAKWNSPETIVESIGLSQTDVNKMCDAGAEIYKYLCVDAGLSYTNNSFIMKIDGYKFIAFNKERFNPMNFNIDYTKAGYDGAACFHYAGGNWNFSLYTTNSEIDCSVICAKRNGGGHRGAAGFLTKNISEYVK